MKQSPRHQQRGAVLLISLVILLIITLLAVSSIRESTLEERIVGNIRNQQAAFNGAESALREGEKRLRQVEPPTTTANCTGATTLCVMANPPNSLHVNDWSWWSTNSNAITYKGSNATTSSLSRLVSSPRWNTAFHAFDPVDSTGRVEVTDPELRSRGVGPYYYEVNAASQGRNDQIMINLQSVSVQRY